MKLNSTKIRVLYADTDKMGYMYYGNFCRYYEIGRTQLMRELGVSYKSLEDRGIMMPVVKVESFYKAPLLYDEEIELRTYIEGEVGAKICFVVEFYDNDGRLRHIGKTTLAFIDETTRRPMRCPREIMEAVGE